MGWQRVALAVPGAQAEALAQALESEGALSTDIADADAQTPDEQAIFGEPGLEIALWKHARVSALFPEDHDASAAIEAALAASGAQALAPASRDRLEDTDWVVKTQRQFEPMRFGERLWIVPTWHAPPDPTALNIVLDPGAAFGTGSHPTTRLCLGWLERAVHPEDSVLDYGCGSGVLAIAALKLGAARATGVDIDPLALEAARYNAAQNAVAVELLAAKDPLGPRYSLAVANILANPLRMLAPLIASHTEPLGRIALSGILESQAADVQAAYAPWAELEVSGWDEGWVLLAGLRNSRC